MAYLNGKRIPLIFSMGQAQKPEQTKTVALDMAEGDQVVTPDEGYVLTEVTVEKPETLIPENIAKDVEIAGVVGTYEGSGFLIDDLTDFSYFHYKRARLDILGQYDTGKGENFSYMFNSCSSLTSIPQLNTSNGTNFSNMFNSCSSLTSIPQLDTSKGENFSNMLSYCSGLTLIPQLNTSNGTNFSNMFVYCSSLTSIPQLDTSNGFNFESMFNGCTNLTTVSFDVINGGNGRFSSIFYNCTNLTNLTILNIKYNIQIGSGSSWGHLLTVASLLKCSQECIKQSSSRTLTIGTANTAKLANVYVKFVDPTQTTIAVGEKGEVVQCESTDTGAMLISDYMTLKNWRYA